MKTTRKNSMLNGLRILSMTALATIAMLAGCGKKEHGEAKTGPQADTATIRVVAKVVQPIVFEDWATYSAELRGAEDAVLTAAMGGRVLSVKAAGEKVKEGEALCDIESDRYQAQYLQAQAAVEVAQGDLERTKSNVEKGAVGKAALDQANLAYQGARVGLLQAKRAYDDSRCRSPFSGVLVSALINRFQTVAPGMPTVRIARVDKLEARIAIPETDAHLFKDGQKAEFFLAQDPGQVYEGRLRSIDRAVENRNRTVEARIEFANPGAQLRPGMIGQARILRKTYEQAVVIPSQAVLRLQEGTAVMTVEGASNGKGVARQVPITLGNAKGDSVHVISGIEPGIYIITEGAFQVSNGTRVTF